MVAGGEGLLWEKIKEVEGYPEVCLDGVGEAGRGLAGVKQGAAVGLADGYGAPAAVEEASGSGSCTTARGSSLQCPLRAKKGAGGGSALSYGEATAMAAAVVTIEVLGIKNKNVCVDLKILNHDFL